MSSPAAIQHNPATVDNSVLLGLRNIYIFPTSNGWVFIISMFLLLLCAINYSSNLLHAMVFFFGGLFLVCLQHTYRTLWGLRLQLGVKPDNAFAGSDLIFSLIVHNYRAEARHGITATIKFTSHDSTGEASSEAQSIVGNSDATINVAIPASRRGWVSIDKIKLGSIYPLGLFRAWCSWPVNESALVYPLAEGSKPLPPADSKYEDETEQGAKVMGHDEYEGLKPYYPGAPLRDIHWKKSLQDDIFVHDFSGYDSRVWMLELKHASDIVKEEQKISQLCMWIMMLREKKQPYGLVLPDTRIEPNTGPMHDQQCLSALALAEL